MGNFQNVIVSSYDVNIITALAQLTGTKYYVREHKTELTDVEFIFPELSGWQFEVLTSILDSMGIYYKTDRGLV